MSALARRIERNPSAPIALRMQLERAAADVGRLRRRFASNEHSWSGLYLVERIALALETVDAILHADAAELQREFFCICGDDDLATEEALAVIDRRVTEFRRLLGERRR